ncbi:MAG: hypothetical protein ACFFEM_16030 [Candidatus Thorarchaeota archaeon]
METTEIRIRYLDISADIAAKSLLVNGDSHKQRALERLGITPRDGETPFNAWLRAMCEENNLPNSRPVPREIADAIVQNPSASRFMWLLA